MNCATVMKPSREPETAHKMDLAVGQDSYTRPLY